MSWGYVAAAAATVIGGVMSSQSASSASRAQEESATRSLNMQAMMAQRQAELQAPFREIGLEAMQRQRALSGLGTQAEQQAAFAAFAESPGQQFLQAQQEQALLRNVSAIGGLGGGNVRTALQEQAMARAQTDYTNQFNRLAALSGTGQVSAQGMASGLGTAATGMAGSMQQAGEARASGILGQSQAWGQTVEQLGGLYSQYSTGGQNRTYADSGTQSPFTTAR